MLHLKCKFKLLKTGKATMIRFNTLEKICSVLNCHPGDILGYVNEP
ncbi:helix-turn-helix domain-containing protein [Enterococcus florum]